LIECLVAALILLEEIISGLSFASFKRIGLKSEFFTDRRHTVKVNIQGRALLMGFAVLDVKFALGLARCHLKFTQSNQAVKLCLCDHSIIS